MEKITLRNYVITFLVVFVIDRCTKFFAMDNFMSYKLWYFFDIVPALNKGLVFGCFAQNVLEHQFVYILISSGLLLYILHYAVVQYKNHQPVYAQVAILAAGLGNIVDRIFYKGVIDFLAAKVYILGDVCTVIFNVADICIVAGVIWLIIESLAQN